jgi:hypothetical protein
MGPRDIALNGIRIDDVMGGAREVNANTVHALDIQPQNQKR